LFDDYFSTNKPDAVTVSLYENHFNDSGNNFSHSVVFAGTLDAIGGMYSRETSATWDLFMTRISQHMKDGFSSATGRQISSHGDASENLRFQRYYLIDVEEGAKFTTAHNTYAEGNVPKGMTLSMGNITLGQGPEGANRWVIVSFKDFKSALGGAYMLRTEAERDANSKAWEERTTNDGEVSLVRSGLRIKLMSW
jgi:hypothetical protein